ncbi:MAG: capsule assembly Wzi family protein [Nitrospirae bacterium]|nr:MAG: capsule assembly Wzi family protein [Nitrospirota bacterium]
MRRFIDRRRGAAALVDLRLGRGAFIRWAWTVAAVTLLLAPLAAAATTASVNVPLDHWAYRAAERLYALGLADTALLGARPWSREDFARLVLEARERPGAAVAATDLARLEAEFAPEVRELEGESHASYLKPVEAVTLRGIAGSGEPEALLAHGDVLGDGVDLRLDWQLHGRLGRHLALFVRPEGRWQSGNSIPFRTRGLDASPPPVDESGGRVVLRETYAKLRLWNLEVEAGRDHLWWGLGRRGSLLLTDNAEPLDLLKVSNPDPVLLPWLLRWLGPVKVTWFWTELEKHRAIPRANLTGLRVDLKPTPNWEVGLARVIQFGGAGRPGLLSQGLEDLVTGRNAESGETDAENSLAAIDLAWRLRWPRPALLYYEYGGEDQAKLLSTLPFISSIGQVAGLYVPRVVARWRADLRLEFFNNIQRTSPLWYRHGTYRSGYTYRGKILGHPFGGDAEAWSVRLDLEPLDGLLLGLDTDVVRLRTGKGLEREKQYRAGLDAVWFTRGPWRYRARYDFEERRHVAGDPDADQTNHRLELGVTLDL